MSESVTGVTSPAGSLRRSLDALRKLSPTKREPQARCEMCSLPLADVHPHLLEVAPQRLLCACDACALLFSGQAADAKYRRVPRRLLYLADFQLSDAQWDGLLVPINMAFIFHSTPHKRAVALYPSPAGPTESLLELESWNEIVAQNPVLQTLEPDVEALLVNRIGAANPHGPGHFVPGGKGSPGGVQEVAHYLAPIDECFKLVGVIRANWRGLSGGKKVWEEIDAYFVDLKARSQTRREPSTQGPSPCPT
jgi:Family of unknown function (DUF5947)